MTDEDAFLAALHDNNADDVTRLVYADWLEEHDDPRAHFLRAEVALARLAADAPGLADAERASRLLRRAGDPAWIDRVSKVYEVWLLYYFPQGRERVSDTLALQFRFGPVRIEQILAHQPARLCGGVRRDEAEVIRAHFTRTAFDWNDVPRTQWLPWVAVRQSVAPAKNVEVRAATEPMGCGWDHEAVGEYEVWIYDYAIPHTMATFRALREATGQGTIGVKELLHRPLPFCLLRGTQATAQRIAAMFPADTDLDIVRRTVP